MRDSINQPSSKILELNALNSYNTGLICGLSPKIKYPANAVSFVTLSITTHLFFKTANCHQQQMSELDMAIAKHFSVRVTEGTA